MREQINVRLLFKVVFFVYSTDVNMEYSGFESGILGVGTCFIAS